MANATTDIKKNEIITLGITALSNDGSGIGKIGEKVVFVPFTAVGDEVEAKVLKNAKSIIYAKLERIIKSSPDRIEADCPVFGKGGKCGGCDFRHISYEAEILAKEGFIKDAFTRIGKLTPEFLPLIPSPEIERYRNKAQFPVGKDNLGEVIHGFYASKSHRIIPCRDCRLHPVIFGEIAEVITDFIRANKLSVYDEATNSGVIRHICIRQGKFSGEINVCLVARRKIPELAPLARLIKEKFPSVKGVTLNVNKSDNNVIFGDKDINLIGENEISDIMNGVKVAISPRSFYQINTLAAEKLYDIIKDFALSESSENAETSENNTILDLYCGIGTIGLYLAKNLKNTEIIGVEKTEASVENARVNAKLNGVQNARFICSDVNALSSFPEISEASKSIETIILDPARKGAEKEILEAVARLNPKRIIMVSCSPPTSARDCAFLEESGFKVAKVKGVDLFPRTRHVECAALLVNENYQMR